MPRNKKNGPPKQPFEQKPSKNLDSGFPALEKDTGTAAKTEYEVKQEDEIIALQSIFGDDFERVDVEGAGAWKKRQPCFRIHVRGEDDLPGVVLQVELTATYPKSIPLLSISQDDELKEATRQKIKHLIATKPKELVVFGDAFIFTITGLIQEILRDTASADSTTLPSLEAERAIQEHEAAEAARAAEAEAQRQNYLKTMEEENALNAELQNEMNRRAKVTEGKRRDRRASVEEVSATEVSEMTLSQRVTFDQRVKVIDSDDNMIVFQSVTGKNLIRTGQVAKVYTVRPVVIGGDVIPTLVLKQTHLKDGDSEAVLRKNMHELETELEKVKQIRHSNILALHDFRFSKTEMESQTSPSESSLWTVSLLTEYANKGSLEEVLEIAGTIPIPRARTWINDLLKGLAFLHDKGIIHKDIHPANIMVIRTKYGEMTAKLGDGGYQKQLHLLGRKEDSSHVFNVAKSAYWVAPETTHGGRALHSMKTDVWDFGIICLNMLFGMTVLEEYTSPKDLAEGQKMTASCYEFIEKIFRADPQKRPRASELGHCEFLVTDAEVLEQDDQNSEAQPAVNFDRLNTPIRPRHNSVIAGKFGPFFNSRLKESRYKEDFIEESKLGKGGYGVVMKVRKKLDGQFYAVKKIVQKRSSATLTGILKEVRVLSTLSHPYVVRYYNTWTEEFGYDRGDEAVFSDTDPEGSPDEDSLDGDLSDEDLSDADMTDEEISSSDKAHGAHDDDALEILFEKSISHSLSQTPGDLDYVNSQITFDYDTGSDDENEYKEEDAGTEDDDDEEDEAGTEDDTEKEDAVSTSTDEADDHDRKELPSKQRRSSSRILKSTRTILYIQMEFCARRTLADLIKGNLYKEKDQVWRIFRQILEALVYIHGMGVLHRDLKPPNVFMDERENIRIGDFGLATNSQASFADKSPPSNQQTEMTRSVGTSYYVAPEVRSSGGGDYGSKADMYSLGIMFFEMCYPPIVGMERADKLNKLRDAEPKLPQDFDARENEAEIILSLVKHNPKERPSASEILRGGKLPQAEEEDAIKQIMAKISDSDDSDGYKHIVSALFSMPPKPAKDVAWDMTPDAPLSSNELLLQSIVKERLTNIFRLHGALEMRRNSVLPHSKHYLSDNANAVKLLDPSGLVMQLPYDLTLPNARALARQPPPVLRSFAFGNVYRPRLIGGQYQVSTETEFDIVSQDTLDLAMKEAEAIKVMDEIVGSIPSLDVSKHSIRLNNADLLPLIFEFCRIDSSKHDSVAETLSRYNVSTWSQIRTELRGPLIRISNTSLNDLQKFDFKDSPEKAFKKLKGIFAGSEMLEKASSAIGHLKDVVTYLERFQVKMKYFVSPLSSMNQKFYKGGVMFQCISENRKKTVLAAGGRYDSLIREYRNQTSRKHDSLHAVGLNFGLGPVLRTITDLQQLTGKQFLKKQEALNGVWAARRCDVLVASFDPTTLRAEGTQIVAKLWTQEISAELAVDTRSPEDLQAKYSKDPHCWHVIIKQDSMLKVKSLFINKPDADIPASQLVTHLRGEIRERDQHNGTYDKTRLHRHASQAPDSSSTPNNPDQEVQVVFAEVKGKKSNRQHIVEQAHEKAASLAHSFLDGPIVAIETTDRVLDMIRETRLFDPESWRTVIQNAPTAEKNYIKEVHSLLDQLAVKYKGTTRNAFVYNFRSGTCIYYDLGKESVLRPTKGKERSSDY